MVHKTTTTSTSTTVYYSELWVQSYNCYIVVLLLVLHDITITTNITTT